MQFIKKFFKHENTIIGLSGLRKKENYIKVHIPINYKKTYIPSLDNNYILNL